MVAKEKISEFSHKLLERRAQVLGVHGELHDDRLALRLPEPEFEERAQKDNIARVIDQLDIRQKDEIEAITQALERINENTYGLCQSCGGEISPERLEAVPWTPFCENCEKRTEKSEAQPPLIPVDPPGELPADYTGMSDDEIVNSIYETLKVDYRLETQELRIDCRNGALFLQGFMPNEGGRQVLLGILQDALGFQDIVDEIVINPILWERNDRTRGENYPSEDVMQEILVTVGKGDVSHRSELSATDDPPEDKLVTPPDEFIPEDKQ